MNITKLTRNATTGEVAEALHAAAMARSQESLGVESYAFACGSLHHLVSQILRTHPKTLKEVNAYLAATPATPAAN